MTGRRLSALLLALLLLGCSSAHADGESSSPRSSARAWVKAMRSGNARAGCELQVTPEVNGKACAAQPPITYNCPKMTKPLPKVKARTVGQELGQERLNGSAAAIVVKAAPIKSSFKVVLGLELTEGWRVSYVRSGSTVYSPAGEIVNGSVVRRLWPGCVRLVS